MPGHRVFSPHVLTESAQQWLKVRRPPAHCPPHPAPAQIQSLVPGPCSGMAPDVFELANEPHPASCFPGDNYTNLGATAPFMGEAQTPVGGSTRRRWFLPSVQDLE